MIAVEEDFGGGEDLVVGFEVLDANGKVFGGEDGCEAGQGDVSGNEEECAGEGDAGGGSDVAALHAKSPGDGWAEAKSQEGEDGGEAEGGEGLAGQVEQMRGGEGVVADGAVGEEVADVWNEGEVAGVPEAVGQGGGDQCSENGEGGVGEADVAAAGFVDRVGLLGAGDGGAGEEEDGEPGREGVVLLVGGEGEEEEDEGCEEGEEEGGAGGEGEFVAGYIQGSFTSFRMTA